MAEDNINEQEEINVDVDYIQAIQDLKKNTVPKETLEKVQAQNRQLLDALIKNQQLGQPEPEQQQPEPEDIRELVRAQNQAHLNLDYVKASLAARKAVMDMGGEDPYLPIGHELQPSQYDRERAQAVADVFQHCVDYAQGDSAVFTNELQRLTRDTLIPGRR